jgi:hypothetical protein
VSGQIKTKLLLRSHPCESSSTSNPARVPALIWPRPGRAGCILALISLRPFPRTRYASTLWQPPLRPPQGWRHHRHLRASWSKSACWLPGASYDILPGRRRASGSTRAACCRDRLPACKHLPGSYLGPILRLRRGQTLKVHFENQINEPSIIHWHGLSVPDEMDGHPRHAIEHGQSLYLRIPHPEPRRDLLVPPPSPPAHRPAGLLRPGRAADRFRR